MNTSTGKFPAEERNVDSPQVVYATKQEKEVYTGIERTPVVGEAVYYHDPTNRLHNAIITAVWSNICLNVVVVSLDENKTDGYGRQIERYTSLTKGSIHRAPGNYWRFLEDEPNNPVSAEQV